jgi:alkyldihydroxyacetonephosphate synthase
LSFLQEKIGVGTAPHDATFAAVCTQLPASRLPEHALVDRSPEVRLRHALGQSMSDWLRLRYGKIDSAPDGVAFPESSEQVRQLLDWAKVYDVLVIPYGGGTSVVGHLGAPIGPKPVLTISLARLSRLLNLDKESQLATFGAGVLGPDLEAQLRAHGYTLGHFPQSFEYASLGGWIVTRSSGQQSLRYGRIEQMFAGARVETPVGRLDIPTFPASAAGPDLREMVLGSEGRIGIVTEATMRVTPLPEQEGFYAVFFPNWDKAAAAIRQLVQAKLPLSMLRLSNALETETMLALAGHAGQIRWLERYLGWRGCGVGKCMLMIGISHLVPTVRATLATALSLVRAHDGVSTGRILGEKWKAGRFKNVYLRNMAWQHGYAIDTCETAVDWPRVNSTMQAVEQAGRDAFAAFGEKVHAYTHLSHLYAQGASVYSTFIFRLSGNFEEDLARWQKLKAAMCNAIVASGGTISHQHGVGVDHAPYLVAEKGELGMAALNHMMRHFDPDQRMNPGKLLPSGEA